MDYIKDWLKTILYVNVFLLICDSFIQKTKYEKYIRFFSGFLLMICLVRPLFDLTNLSTFLDSSYLQEALKNELDIVGHSEDLKAMEEDIRNSYHNAIEEQIIRLGEKYDVEVTDVTVEWREEDSGIRFLEIKGRYEGEEGKSPRITQFRDTLIQVYHLDEANINIEMRE